MNEPIIIIGAPRSGTNMLRDMLVKLDGVETWPCDEINYIWRHGNLGASTDKFSVEMASPKVKTFLHKAFSKFKKQSNADIVVEKTCASSLRVSFINEVFPDAKFIYIVRDGADVVGSAKLRWTAKLDIPYVLKKLKYVPMIDTPYYAVRYAWHRVFKIFSKEDRLASWGPVLPKMQEIVASNTLLETCAIQWKACVQSARKELNLVEKDRVYQLRYEDFVSDPAIEFQKLALFIGKMPDDKTIDAVVGNTSAKSLGKGRKEIPEAEFHGLNKIMASEQEFNGYQQLRDAK